MSFRISLKGFIMAATSAYGLLLIILFLGFGLISIPKEHALKSDVYELYAHNMYKVTLYKKKMDDSKEALKSLIRNVVLLRRAKLDNNLKPNLQVIYELCPRDIYEEERKERKRAKDENKAKYKDEWYIEARYAQKDYAALVRLHSDLKSALNETLKTNNSFVNIIDKAIFYTDLQTSKDNANMRIVS